MKDDKDLMEPEIRPAEDPKDCGFYETGNTRPPKNHHKLVAVLLVLALLMQLHLPLQQILLKMQPHLLQVLLLPVLQLQPLRLAKLLLLLLQHLPALIAQPHPMTRSMIVTLVQKRLTLRRTTMARLCSKVLCTGTRQAKN